LENFEREREREVELWRRREKILLEASISRLVYIVDFKVESTASKGWCNTIFFRGRTAEKFTEIEEDE
jgi:hypothetical protein